MAAESRFQRLQSLFDAALELAAADRPAFVDDVCGGDDALRLELRALLAHAESGDARFDEQATDAARAMAAQALPGATLRTIGPYTLHEVLGDGGMGRVYRATRLHDGIHQEVAIKVVRGGQLNERLAARLAVERRLLAQLKHPGICRFLDAGTLADGMPYVVMECVHGQALLAHCTEAQLDVRARVRLLRQICAAVAYAHGHLVIHRDIKSGNVLVDTHGQPKLLDFGIAKSMQAADVSTQPADRFLSPQSAAPEQLRGDSVGVACDVYALGTLAYELLCGHLPLELAGCSAAEFERRLLSVPPPLMSQRLQAADQALARERGGIDVRTLRAQLRGDLDAIVARCLRKEPGERYATVAQLDEDLGRVLERQPISIRAGDGWYRARKFVARHRLGVGLGAALISTLAVSSVLIAVQSVEVERQRLQAVRERNVAQEVVDVLKEAFTAADPSGLLGANVRASDILAAARPRIEALRTAQPGAFADLALVLAEVEFGLGLDVSAAPLAQQALEAAQDAEWPEASLRPLWLLKLRMDTHAGRHEDAEIALQTLQRMDGGQTSADLALEASRLWSRQGDLSRATRLLREAASATATLGVNELPALSVRLELANVLRMDKQLDESLAVYDQTLIWLRQSLPDDHGKVLRTRMRRLYALIAKRGDDGTVIEAADIAQGLSRTYGADSPLAAVGQALLGIALEANDRPREAIAPLEQALAIWESRLGPVHRETVRARFNVAEILGHAGEPLEGRAEALYLRTVADAETAFGPHGNSTLHMKLGYARSLQAANRVGDALGVLLAPASLQAVQAAREDIRLAHRECLRQALATPYCGNQQDPRCTAAQRFLAPTSQAGAGR